MSLVSKTFGELITFTRATGGGRFNADGVYEWLAADQPRIDYDPVTRECRGILIEEQRTNFLLQSASFENAPWSVPGGAGGSGNRSALIATSAAVAPDNSTTGVLFHQAAASFGSIEHYVEQTVSVLSAGDYTYSLFVKPAQHTQITLRPVHSGATSTTSPIHFDLLTNSLIGALPTGQVMAAGVVDALGGWKRVWVTARYDAGITMHNMRIQLYKFNAAGNVYAGDGVSGLFIWGGQLESGTFPTSYIPTTTAQVTRVADACSVNTLDPWFRRGEGCLLVEWGLPVNDADSNQLAAFGSSMTIGSMAVRLGFNNGRRVRAFMQDAAGVFQYASDCALEASTKKGKSAIAYKDVNDFVACSNSALSPVDRSGGFGEFKFTLLRIGANGGSRANGHIRRIRYIPRRISDTELQALTA